MQTKYLTPEEVDQEYKLPVNTLKHWRWQGIGPAYLKVGRRIKYRRNDVEAWLDAQSRQTADSARLRAAL